MPDAAPIAADAGPTPPSTATSGAATVPPTDATQAVANDDAASTPDAAETGAADPQAAMPPPATTSGAEPAPVAAAADGSTASAPADATSPASAETADGTNAGASDASPPPAVTADAPDPDATAAEGDFDALYGASAASDAGAGVIRDPWEPYNRRMHRFNNAVDRRVAKPLATVYVKVVPRPIRSGVSNFFSNLGQPITALNALLQGKPKLAAHSLGRFVINSTLGIAGIFDPATDAKLENGNEDFGQTLGVWGWKRSRYVELPLFGPRTLRDVVGMAGDAPLSPLRQVGADRIRVPLQGLQLVDLRATLMSTDPLREGAQDDYRLVRDAWLQRRAYQIGGAEGDDTPDYLKDDPALVPVNAMPVMPPSGG